MQRFLIERAIPDVGALTPTQLRDAARHSNTVLRDLGPDIQWVQSYRAADRLFCVYLATDVDLVRRHAELSGFPATRIVPIDCVIDPTTATSRC